MAESMSNFPSKELFTYKGCNMSSIHTIERLDQMENYNVHDYNVFVVTYPKSVGQFYQELQQIEKIAIDLAVLTDLQAGECKPSYSVVPWLEITHKEINTNDRPSPCFFVTHLPYQLIPKSPKNKKAKVIYVYRNPKDVAVSYNHFHKFANYLKSPENFGAFLQTFLNGQVDCDNWFDHVRNWFDHGHEFNIMFLSYEEMIKDLRAAILKFISFLGRYLDNKSVDIVVERSTFKNMKSNPNSNFAGFMREGIVGDWTNYFTTAENEMFDRIFQEKMKNFPLKYT
ncbi:amine sulfotransferase-like [Hemiscyllium ocellatum]|uniref:amine sulfotransferase-like n=1 Tax=Hemiscyllium ocellatum TaxID=170820 RepID=UPI00296630FC|nr:amine sulfotransferase-like [Hemiscyllium ocellatum]